LEPSTGSLNHSFSYHGAEGVNRTAAGRLKEKMAIVLLQRQVLATFANQTFANFCFWPSTGSPKHSFNSMVAEGLGRTAGARLSLVAKTCGSTSSPFVNKSIREFLS